MDEYDLELEARAALLDMWLRQQVAARWPAAHVERAGRTATGTTVWRIEHGGASHHLGVTDPALLAPALEQTTGGLEAMDWLGVIGELAPDGLLAAAGGRYFAWDRERDRGTRLLDGGR